MHRLTIWNAEIIETLKSDVEQHPANEIPHFNQVLQHSIKIYSIFK